MSTDAPNKLFNDKYMNDILKERNELEKNMKTSLVVLTLSKIAEGIRKNVNVQEILDQNALYWAAISLRSP